MDGGDWESLLTNSQSTNYQYPGDYGHRYTFRLSASDNVGNEAQAEAEATTKAVTKYYYFGGQRVAMRGPDDAVSWLHGDHLGSTSLATDAVGGVVTRQFYLPFGGPRGSASLEVTDFGFTGQRKQSTIGLYDYHARFYDPLVGRFVSADSVVPQPGNPQDLNRYSYVRNRPLNGIDPSGHICIFGVGIFGSCDDEEDVGKKAALAVIKPIANAWSAATTAVKTTEAVLFGKNPFSGFRAALPEGTNDLTEWLVGRMQANAQGEIAQTLRDANQGGVFGQYAATLAWTALVKGGGPWDFKVDLIDKGIKCVKLAGEWYNFDVVANIHYGFVGKASGFSEDALLNGAGIAQIMSGTSDWSYFMSRFDDPDDAAAILVGVYLWQQYGDQELASEMLREALQRFDQWMKKAYPGARLIESDSQP